MLYSFLVLRGNEEENLFRNRNQCERVDAIYLAISLALENRGASLHFCLQIERGGIDNNPQNMNK